MGVTNTWHILNLRSTPFFQHALEPGERGPYPLTLFVGRDRELARALKEIGGASNTQIAIQGPPGVGKTTLVNRIKAEAAADGYLVDAAPISVTSVATVDDLRLAILRSVHDAMVARFPASAQKDPVRQVRQLLSLELSRSWTASASVLGSGGGIGRTTQATTGPGAVTVQPVRLLRQLGEFALDELMVPGIVIHLNNLENATEANQRAAARIVRDLRDTGLTFDGFHYILAGTDESIRTIVTAQEQLRSIFHNPGSLKPLEAGEVDRLLRARYEHLRLFDDRAYLEPVTTEAVHRLYGLFRGNLRGTLHALHESANLLIGRGPTATDPMTFGAMVPALTTLYAEELQTELKESQRRDVQWIATQKGGVTQAMFGRHSGRRSAGGTSEAMATLRRAGYVEEVLAERSGKPGRPTLRYGIAAKGRFALGLVSAEEV